jgi:hypothetical protein
MPQGELIMEGVEPLQIDMVVCPCNAVDDFSKRCYIHQPLQPGEEPPFPFITQTSTTISVEWWPEKLTPSSSVGYCIDCGQYDGAHLFGCQAAGTSRRCAPSVPALPTRHPHPTTPRLSDEDIDRIAKRVADLVKADSKP